jgi:transaldolase/glucose-6-phosphate isomerase
MATNAERLRTLGQSVWLDFIRRGFILSGEFDRLIGEQGVVGVTSNPTIFHQAITSGNEYDGAIRIAVARGLAGEALFDSLAIEDIRMACDRLRPVHQQTQGLDGRVSIEVSPRLAYDTRATIAEARRLKREVDRLNLLVKIPATEAGLGAIQEATAEGLSINVTLIFSLARYEQVMEAYLSGLEARVALDQPIDGIFSVASFFVSRVDTKVDHAIDVAVAPLAADDPKRRELESARGQAAIANARLAYRRYRSVFDSPRFEKLKARGAHVQRPLWASTSTKNPAYRDTLYVDELIGPETVNTMPLPTLTAFNHHGRVEVAIDRDLDRAEALFERLPRLGIPIEELIAQLEPEGVETFRKSYDTLLEALEDKRRSLHERRWVKPNTALGEAEPAVRARAERLAREGFLARLWSKDDALWGDDPAHRAVARTRLGWLDAPSRMRSELPAIRDFRAEVMRDGYLSAVLLGMGGSSLAPAMLRQAFGVARGAIDLTVLDSTSPAAVRAITRDRDPAKTLFLVGSKSGTTTEVLSFEKHFHSWVSGAVGARAAGRSFAAITDPGTPLEALARERGYRRVFSNPPDVGGRYSALTLFGLVPAALIGVDLEALLEHALDEARASGPDVPWSQNFALELGTALGELARAGRDKPTFVIGAEIASLGDWIEQLLAESTGKSGKGLVPVVGEPLATPDAYGRDRVFISLYMKPFAQETESRLDRLQREGHPVLRWRVPELPSIGAECLRWEIATAIAAAIIEVDPFDEPNVTEAKQATRAMLDRYAASGTLPALEPLAVSGDVEIAAPAAIAPALRRAMNGHSEPGAWASALLSLARPGDYFAVLAYLQPSAARDETLTRLRVAARAATHLATTTGYGPRFLHSTGQLHKGGPDSGIFLQLTADEGEDVPIPGEKFGFSALIRAQAAGDYQVLENRGRRVMRIHLGKNPDRALDEIASALSTTRV